MWRRVGVVLVLIAASFAVSAPSHGIDGLRYVKSADKTVQPGQLRASHRVMCPRRTQVVGGGIASSSINAPVMASFPIDGRDRGRRPDDGWQGLVNNPTTSATTMRIYAVCASSGRYQYVRSAPADAPSGEQTTVRADCDEETQVVGGGVVPSGVHATIDLGSTFPFDDQTEAGDVPDNGWFGAVNNDSGATQTVRAFAICAATGTYTYEQPPSANVPDTGFSGVQALCPNTSHVMSGGVSLGGGNDFEIKGTTFVDFGDGDGEGDDGWSGTVYNHSGVTLQATVIAICRPI